jgi:hypothetical protein
LFLRVDNAIVSERELAAFREVFDIRKWRRDARVRRYTQHQRLLIRVPLGYRDWHTWTIIGAHIFLPGLYLIVPVFHLLDKLGRLTSQVSTWKKVEFLVTELLDSFWPHEEPKEEWDRD